MSRKPKDPEKAMARIRADLETLASEAKAWDERRIDPKTWDNVPRMTALSGETEAICFRLPKDTITILKEFAKRKDIGYQTLIKMWLDEKILELYDTMKEKK
jgi:predicted DNA binding CopG/RHH family protein